MSRKREVAVSMKSARRAELLLLEAQRDLLDSRIRLLEKQPISTSDRNLKRDLPSSDVGKEAKRAKHNVGFVTLDEMFNQCRKILTQLKKNTNAGPFLMPVDPVALNCPDYFTIVKKPMDFKTIHLKLRPAKRVYESPLQFRDDVRQVFLNCSLYNPIGNHIRTMGDRLSEAFERLWDDSDIERMYQKRTEGLKRGRSDKLESKRKRLRTCSPQAALSKIAKIQSKLKEVMNTSYADPTSEMESDKPMTFWQKRKLSEHLEKALPDEMMDVSQLLPETEEVMEMTLDDMSDEVLKRLWGAVMTPPSHPSLPTDNQPLVKQNRPSKVPSEVIKGPDKPQSPEKASVFKEKDETELSDFEKQDVEIEGDAESLKVKNVHDVKDSPKETRTDTKPFELDGGNLIQRSQAEDPIRDTTKTGTISVESEDLIQPKIEENETTIPVEAFSEGHDDVASQKSKSDVASIHPTSEADS